MEFACIDLYLSMHMLGAMQILGKFKLTGDVDKAFSEMSQVVATFYKVAPLELLREIIQDLEVIGARDFLLSHFDIVLLRDAVNIVRKENMYHIKSKEAKKRQTPGGESERGTGNNFVCAGA